MFSRYNTDISILGLNHISELQITTLTTGSLIFYLVATTARYVLLWFVSVCVFRMLMSV